MKNANQKMKPEFFVGLDVHLRSTSICIFNARGKIVKEKAVAGHSKEVCTWCRKNIKGTFDVVFEACDGYGLWVEKLEKIANNVVVAHPYHLKAIWNTKRKTDRIDAQKLAQLLLLGMIPPVHVPSKKVRGWRTLIQMRRSFVQKRTAIKNQIRAVLRRNHVKSPKNLWSQKQQQWLAEVTLPEHEQTQLDILRGSVAFYDEQIAALEAKLDQAAEGNPNMIVLKTIKGIANRTAEAFVAWIDEPTRFSRSKQIGAYLGFAVAEDSSGGRQRLGHITRLGPSVVRHLLVEAVQRMYRYDPTIQRWVDRVMHDQPKRKQIAIVAAAHKLSRAMFAMLKTGEVWNPMAYAMDAPEKTASAVGGAEKRG